MAIKLTAKSFLVVVKLSRWIPPNQLKRLMVEFKETAINLNSSREIADALVFREFLTRWQAGKLL